MSKYKVYNRSGSIERCTLNKVEYNGSFMDSRVVNASVESSTPTVSAPAGEVQMLPKLFKKIGGLFKKGSKAQEAAMFAGIALMVRIFSPSQPSTETDIVVAEERLSNEYYDELIWASCVDDYSVYEYFADAYEY